MQAGLDMTLKVILDSNFLFLPLQFKIDIFEAIKNLLNRKHELTVLSTTVDELQELAQKGSPKVRKQAKMGLKFIERCRIVAVRRSSGESNDDVILRVARKWKCPVATNDRMLRQRLRDISIPVIYLRQKSRLELEGSI